MLIGDDHAAIDKAEESIHQALGCHIYKREIFYRKEGFDAVSTPFFTRCRPLTWQPWSRVAVGNNQSNEVAAASLDRHGMPFDDFDVIAQPDVT